MQGCSSSHSILVTTTQCNCNERNSAFEIYHKFNAYNIEDSSAAPMQFYIIQNYCVSSF